MRRLPYRDRPDGRDARPIRPLRATTNESLRNEFDKAISKWVARDSKGQYYLLSILPNGQGKVALALRVAKARSAGSIEEFFFPRRTAIFDSGRRDRILSGGMVIDAPGPASALGHKYGGGDGRAIAGLI